MSDDRNHAFAIIERQHEHYLKLLDVFETRQTWAFNFATLLYTGAFTVFGVLIDKMYKPDKGWAPEYHVVAASVVMLSVALPILMLPLCFLYSDVSVFCAALTEGNLPYISENYQALLKRAPEYVPPGVRAFRWLKRHEMSIEWVANLRVSLFYIAPVGGLVVACYVLWLRLYHSDTFGAALLLNAATIGIAVSSGALVLTFWACTKTISTRKMAHSDKGRDDGEELARTPDAAPGDDDFQQEGYRCSVCRQWHGDLPWSYSAKTPSAVAAIPEPERGWRTVLTPDQCIIDQRQFFLRGRIVIPVLNHDEPLIWGVWARVSQADFLRANDLWKVEGREREPAYTGWLNTEIPLYKGTMNMELRVHTQVIGRRPHFEIVDPRHPLAVEQREGIPLRRVQRIAEEIAHPKSSFADLYGHSQGEN
jgi:hypothetical protein